MPIAFAPSPLALVLALITVLVGRKYNVLLGLCFGFTFLLSPWIVNFSNSVYWVEVTWFLPCASRGCFAPCGFTAGSSADSSLWGGVCLHLGQILVRV